MMAHKKKVYLVYVDILGFENLAEDIANNIMSPEMVRTSFVNTIREELRRCRVEGLLIGKSFARDDWILAIDNNQKVLSVISRMLNLDIPMEIGIGIKYFNKFANLEGNKIDTYKETIEFLKFGIIKDYHKWYKDNNGESIKETFIVITDSFFNELVIADQNSCEQILFENRHFHYLPNNIIERENKINDFLNKIKHERSDFSGALIDRVFIPPDGYDEIKKTLERDRIVFITGTAGYGKTYTSIKLLWEYFNSGYTPKWISGKDDIERKDVRDKLANIESQLDSQHILYFEDPFGKTNYESRDDLKERISHIINTVKNRDNVFVIITSRKDVFEEFEKESYSEGEIREFEQELNILQPAYNSQKRAFMLKRWATEKGCKWLGIEELENLIYKSIENKEKLPTPLSIYDFVEATIKTTDQTELDEKIFRYSKSTSRAFADEIIGLYKAGRKDRVLLLSLIFISEKFELDLIKNEYANMKDENFENFENILEEEYRVKERIFKKEKYLEFSHSLYKESIKNVLKNPGCLTIFNEVSKNLLNHELRYVQIGTAESLGNIGDSRAVPLLIESSNDPHENVRRACAWALGNIRDSRAVPLLIELLNDNDFAVRRTSIEALGKIGEPSAVPLLIETLNGTDISARKASAEALGRIKDHRAIMPLIKNLENPDTGILLKSIIGLGNIGDSEAVLPLIELLKNSFGDIRYEIIIALGKIGKPAIEPLIKVIKREISIYEPYWIDHSRTTEGLKEISSSILEYVIILLGDSKPIIRKAAIETLRIIGDPKAVEPLIHIILNDQELDIRRAGIRALREIKDGKIITPFINILNNGDTLTKLEVITALGMMNGPQTINPLIKMLKDLDPRIRENAAEILGKMGNPIAIEPLQELILCENSLSSVIYSATNAINKIGNQKSVQFFIKLLKDSNTNIKKRCVEALGEFKDLSAVRPLIGELSNTDTEIIFKVVQALGELRDKKGVEPLIVTLKHDNPDIQEEVIFALAKIDDISVVKPIVDLLKDDLNFQDGAIWNTLKEISGSRLVDNIVESIEFDFDDDEIENPYSIRKIVY